MSKKLFFPSDIITECLVLDASYRHEHVRLGGKCGMDVNTPYIGIPMSRDLLDAMVRSIDDGDTKCVGLSDKKTYFTGYVSNNCYHFNLTTNCISYMEVVTIDFNANRVVVGVEGGEDARHCKATIPFDGIGFVYLHTLQKLCSVVLGSSMMSESLDSVVNELLDRDLLKFIPNHIEVTESNRAEVIRAILAQLDDEEDSGFEIPNIVSFNAASVRLCVDSDWKYYHWWELDAAGVQKIVNALEAHDVQLDFKDDKTC